MTAFKFASTLFLLFFLSASSLAQEKQNPQQYYNASGRFEKFPDGRIILIGSASSVGFDFKGNSCSVTLESADSWEHHNYVLLELDGQYIGRLKIEKGEAKSYPVSIKNNKENHHLEIYKATEAANGTVIFSGTTASLTSPETKKPVKKIEFIGNSITCGMGNDTVEIPCGKGQWFDQHNAYWAYGPILSRILKTDFLLSSVSGIGMYRNWNDEHQNEAIMPDVYQNLYLNKTNAKPFNTDFQPDLVSICLGTNDLSDGDGKKPRLPFNEENYINNYITFIKMIYQRYPNTRLVLLSSPMVSGDKNLMLVKCLKRIIIAFENDTAHKPISLFEYQPMSPNGCGSHPDIEDHKLMAEQLEPLFKKLLDEK